MSDKTIKQIHVIVSNHQVCKKENKVKDKLIAEQEKDKSSLKTQRTLGFIGVIIVSLLAIIF